MKSAIFVDLSNFYGSCLKSGIVDEQTMRGYFVDWIDFDRLAYYLTNDWCPVWVFYSKDRVGPSNFRIEKSYLSTMIDRMNRQRGVTARDVNIPGEQRERYEFVCENCQAVNKTESVGEKGVDASLTVHLFETMNTWDAAYLLSGDADFVPVVSSLRRLGKDIITVSSQNTSPALIRESYDTRNLDFEFLEEDLLIYRLFCVDGFLDKWFTKPEDDTSILDTVSLSFVKSKNNPSIPIEDVKYYMETGSSQVLDTKIILKIAASRNIDFTENEKRKKAISDFFKNRIFVDFYFNQNYLAIPLLPVTFLSITRHLDEFLKRNPQIKKYPNDVYSVDFK